MLEKWLKSHEQLSLYSESQQIFSHTKSTLITNVKTCKYCDDNLYARTRARAGRAVL